MTTTEILTGIKTWVLNKLSLKQDVISDLTSIRSGSRAGSTAVQPSDLSSYFNNASYDTNTHRINFYHGQNVVAYIDASPFIVDGMINDVRIESGYLVIDFNTDSGKQDISIPLTDIFDPSNYYNKTQTDDLLAQKQDMIQDLANIRGGAQAGSTAVQPSTLNDVVKNMVAESGVYDVSANNDNTKFESLSALLNSANLNTLIQTDIRKGGMSIKFVQSSDNKYVQYRLMSQTFSTNEVDWALMQGDVYVDNLQYLAAFNDNDNHLLLWIRAKDGGIDWAVGVPRPVKSYVDTKVAEIWNGNEGTQIDGLNKVIAFLEGFVSDSNLTQYLNNTYGEYVENPEYIDVEGDTVGHLLERRKSDGTKIFDTKVVVNKKLFGYGGIYTNSLQLSDDAFQELVDQISDADLGWNTHIENLYPKHIYDVIFGNLNRRSKLREEDGGQGKQESSVKPLIFLHFSDTHGDGNNLNRIAEFYNLYSNYITDVLHTGDSVTNYYEDDFSFWLNNSVARNFLQVIGNHDTWTDGNHGHGSDMTKYSEEDCYKRYFIGYLNDDWSDSTKLMTDNPLYQNWGAQLVENKCYYYKDYSDQKVRIIVIDTNNYNSTQDAWVESKLNDILTNKPDYHVIIVGHHFPKYKALDTPFNTLNPVIDSYSREQLISAVDSFINSGGKFVCWLCGHSHRDQFGYVIDSNREYTNQPVICVNKARCTTDQWTDTVRIQDTISQDLFNIFKVDTYEGLLTLHRVGCQYDQHLQKKETIIYDYINNKIIY